MTNQGKALEHEARAHLTLARLLQQERPAEKRDAVKRVIASGLSIAAMIEKIHEIDRSGEERKSGPPELPTSEEAVKAQAQLWQPLRFPIGKLRTLIKLPLTASTFFRFLFQELPRIREFGRVTHVFSPISILPIVRIDKIVPVLLSGSVQMWATRLSELLLPAIQIGWQVLTKKEYNMLVTLKTICEELKSANFRIYNYRDRDLIDRLRRIETLFYAFHCQADHPDIVASSVSRALLADGEHDDESEEAELLTKSIIFRGYSLPSVYEILLGFNMLKYRRYLTNTDLIAGDLGEIFNTVHFACPPDLQEEIDGAVQRLQTSILSLERQHRDIQRIREYVPSESDAEAAVHPAQEFYDFSDEVHFTAHRTNVVVLVPRFMRKYENTFTPLLGAATVLAGGDSFEIFGKELFQPDLHRLRVLSVKIEQLAFGYRNFAYERFVAVRREGKGAIPIEIEIIRLLQEVITCFTRMGDKLIHILESHPPGRPPDDTPQIGVAEMSHPSITVPHAEETIVSRGFLGGMTVLLAIETAARLCYFAAWYLFDANLVDLPGRDTAILKKIDTQLHALRRLADETVYADTMRAIISHRGAGDVPPDQSAAPVSSPKTTVP